MRLPWEKPAPKEGNATPGPDVPVAPDSTIRTTEKGWLNRLTRAYRDRIPVRIIDDAGIGIDPHNQSLISMGMHAKMATSDWVAVGVSLGLSAAGILFVVLAFLDPEPTSKLGLLVGGGALCALTGGVSAVGILVRRRPPNIEVDGKGFRIRWD
jgi:hypothetical protein